jgi:chromosomal replication initiator protein
MNNTDARHVWEAVLGELQLQVTRPSYQTWLKNTVGISFSDGTLEVGTPSAFVAETLEQRMYSLISQAAERVAHTPIEVRFRVLGSPPGQAAPPVESRRSPAEQPSPGPRRTPEPQAEERTPHYPGLASPRNGSPSPSARLMAAPAEERAASAVALMEPTKEQEPAAQPAPQPQPLPSVRTVPSRRVFNPAYTFATFIVGKSNELAHAAALAVAERPGSVYNPLFIYSDVGLGKTHLLHAIGHAVEARGLHPIYVTTEEFTNEYIKAIREGRAEEFRLRYRGADILLLDDIQFLIGKEQTQEGFFHTFNALHMTGRQVVISSDRPVTALTLLEDRVRSRLAGGLVVDIQAPDLETRLAILRAKADSLHRTIAPAVLQFLAERIHRNIRELEGSLTRLTAYADLVGSEITVDLARRAIADTLYQAERRRPTEQEVLEAVASYFHVAVDILLGRRRDKHTALARQVAMYLLREESHLGLSTIGRALGGKDHSTVLHACQRIAQQMDTDAHLRRDVLNIREVLGTTGGERAS